MRTIWKCAYDGTVKKLKDGRCAACGRDSLKKSQEDAKAWDRLAEPTHTLMPSHDMILPWKCETELDREDYRVRNTSGLTVAHCSYKEHAAFIVRAVNTHEILVNALKDATRLVCECIPEDPEFPEFIKYKKDLLQAIAKAEGK